MRIADGDPCNHSFANISLHTGTHVDMPLHFIDGGDACHETDPGLFYGEAKVVRMAHVMAGVQVPGPITRHISRDDLLPLDIRAGDIILLDTGQSGDMQNGPLNKNFKTILPNAAEYLAECKIKTLGIDCLSVDPFVTSDYAAHKILLSKGIGVLEGLVLDGVPQGRYTLSAFPLKFRSGDGSPVRAVLIDSFAPELVVFDMDGLMLDTEPISRDGWRHALEARGLGMTDELFAMILGRGADDGRRVMEAYYSLPEWAGKHFDYEDVRLARSEYVRRYVEQNGVGVKPGLHDILDKLDGLGIKKCVATSTEYDTMKWKLESLGLYDRFDGFVTGDRVSKGKPDPEIFLTAAKKMGVPPGNCLVLEDSPAGVAAAYAAGMRPIMVPDLATPGQGCLARVYAVCGSLHEAAGLIEGLVVPH
jgi:HAD superfamily hydrolase (TIGR01509 family)